MRGRIDVLLLHDSPWVEEYEGKIARDMRTQAVGIAVYEARPKAVFCGHLHISPFTIHRFEYGALYVRIDTSQKHRCYAVLRSKEGKIELWVNDRKVEEVSI